MDDNKIYLGNQIELENDRCIGIVTDGKLFVVCEYGKNGQDPKLIKKVLL